MFLEFGQNQIKWGLKQPVEPVYTDFQEIGYETTSQANSYEFCPNIKCL